MRHSVVFVHHPQLLPPVVLAQPQWQPGHKTVYFLQPRRFDHCRTGCQDMACPMIPRPPSRNYQAPVTSCNRPTTSCLHCIQCTICQPVSRPTRVGNQQAPRAHLQRPLQRVNVDMYLHQADTQASSTKQTQRVEGPGRCSCWICIASYCTDDGCSPHKSCSREWFVSTCTVHCMVRSQQSVQAAAT